MLLGFSGLDVEEVSFYKVPFEAAKRYQYAAVAPGATVVIYRYTNWGQDFRAFIERIGFGPDSVWETVADLVRLIFLIDGEVVEEYNYQIASVKKPKQFGNPFIARREIIWKAVNNDTVTHIFEVLCDGMLVMKPEAKARYNV